MCRGINLQVPATKTVFLSIQPLRATVQFEHQSSGTLPVLLVHLLDMLLNQNELHGISIEKYGPGNSPLLAQLL